MDLLQPQNGVTGSMTDPANLTGALTQAMQKVFRAVTWDEVCVAERSNGAGDPCSAHPLLQHQALGTLIGRDASTMSKMNANFLFQGWTSPSAQRTGKYPKQISKSVNRTAAVTPGIWRLHHWSRHKAHG